MKSLEAKSDWIDCVRSNIRIHTDSSWLLCVCSAAVTSIVLYANKSLSCNNRNCITSFHSLSITSSTREIVHSSNRCQIDPAKWELHFVTFKGLQSLHDVIESSFNYLFSVITTKNDSIFIQINGNRSWKVINSAESCLKSKFSQIKNLPTANLIKFKMNFMLLLLPQSDELGKPFQVRRAEIYVHNIVEASRRLCAACAFISTRI